jgi:uncharacterized membrane protein YsdA (DUF1294 family)
LKVYTFYLAITAILCNGGWLFTYCKGGRILIVTVYFIIINIIAFVTMGVDKKRARKHEYRISEKTLWMLAIIGGGTGAFLGMKQFRHKTKHTAFRFGFPILMIIQLVLLVMYPTD